MKVLFLLLSGMLMVGFESRAGGAVPASTPDSTATAAMPDSGAFGADSSVTAVPQRDIFDFLEEFVLHRRVEPEVGTALPIGLSWALLPTLSYNPVYGFAVGAMVSAAGRRGATSPRYSQLSISGNISTKKQIQVQMRGDVFHPSGNYLLKLDCRYLDTTRSTWGLGPTSRAQEEYQMDFNLVRTYATLYARAGGPVFLGVGYHYDEFADIVDQRAESGEATPFTEYSGGALTRTVASGYSISVLGDTRDNLANPSSGYYLNASMRNYDIDIGSDDDWQEMWIEMRVYPHFPSRSRNVLAFWGYAWMTFGRAPYLNLPANGWDTYGRGARGYLQGRIRGYDQIYVESEYRWGLTPDGLWGAVAFLSATITSDTNSGVFRGADPAGGVGLRIKFNKHSNVNLALDFGWGRAGSRGVFMGMSEAF